MAAKTSTSLDMERAELDAVLKSELFTRAPTLAHLLSYLCEKTYAGQSDQIKEYSVGVDVFHRSPDFEQESDSIVRVQANRLRKRLAEYYAGEGAFHPLHITIPVGQYVPVFEEVKQQPTQTQPLAQPEYAPASPFERPLNRFPGKPLMWIAALTLLAALGAVLVLKRQTKPVPAAVADSAVHSLQPLETVGLPMGDELRLLAGGSRSYVDHAGKLWMADEYFTGGTPVKSQVQHIWRTQDPSFYRTSREGNFRYDLPLNRGVYELHLHFAETFYGPENIGSGGEGSRMINVTANGKPLLTNFDVVADAGGSRTADVKVFTDITPASDWQLHLEFSSSDGKAMVSAIEVLPGARGHIRPVRILARQTPYYSNDSQWWSPDAYFKGGQLANETEPAQGTDDPELYESHRWGNFSYAIPVTPGKYKLNIYFSAHALDQRDPASEPQKPTENIFNVFCNNKPILQNFDLRQAGGESVIVRRFSGLEPDAQGKLFLEFIPVKGYATVTGIEVLPQS